MHTWQVQEAKAKLTEFIGQAKQIPQLISCRGKPEIVAMSVEKFNELMGNNQDLVSFLQNSPLQGIEFDLERDKSSFRDIDL